MHVCRGSDGYNSEHDAKAERTYSNGVVGCLGHTALGRLSGDGRERLDEPRPRFHGDGAGGLDRCGGPAVEPGAVQSAHCSSPCVWRGATFVAGCSYTLVQVFAGFLMGQLPYVLDERLICLIASAIAAACWSWEGIFLAKGCGGRDDAGPSGVSRVFDARRMRMVPALFFCIGCLRPLAMMWCFPHFACGALWGTQVVGNPMASLGLVASVIGVGMWVVRIARPGVGSPTGVSRRYACALLGSYASGEVASYAASCAIPLRGPFGELASYGLCMVLVVAVIACVFVVWRHTGQEAVEGGATNRLWTWTRETSGGMSDWLRRTI